MKKWRRFFQWIFFRGFTTPEPVLPVYTLHFPAPDMDVLRQQLVSFYQEPVRGNVYFLALLSDYSHLVELLRREGWSVEMTVNWDGEIMYEILPQTARMDLRFQRLS